MKLMHCNTIIADVVNNELGLPFKVVLREGIPKEYTPFVLFEWWTVKEVTYQRFVEWASQRCFPPNRIDVENELERLGLDHYDAWEIIKRTGGHLVSDHFWIDFTQ